VIIVTIIGSAAVIVYRISGLFKGIQKDIQSLSTSVGKLETRVENLEMKLESRTQSLEAKVESGIQSLEAKVESEIQSLEAKVESRIQSLEAKVESRFEKIEKDISDLKVNLGVMNANLEHVIDLVKTLSIRLDRQDQKLDQLTQNFITHLLGNNDAQKDN